MWYCITEIKVMDPTVMLPLKDSDSITSSTDLVETSNH